MAADQGWSKEQEETLARMWAKGCTCSVIGAAIGKTRNAVIGKRIRLGLPDRKGDILKRRGQSHLALKPPRDHRASAKIDVAKLRKVQAQMENAAKQQPQKAIGDAPAPLMIPLLDLEPQMCRWPANSPERGDEFLFCAHEKERGSPYCSFHQSVAWVGRPQARATRPMRRAA